MLLGSLRSGVRSWFCLADRSMLYNQKLFVLQAKSTSSTSTLTNWPTKSTSSTDPPTIIKTDQPTKPTTRQTNQNNNVTAKLTIQTNWATKSTSSTHQPNQQRDRPTKTTIWQYAKCQTDHPSWSSKSRVLLRYSPSSAPHSRKNPSRFPWREWMGKRYIWWNLEEVSHPAQLAVLAKQGFQVGKRILIVDVAEVVTENSGNVTIFSWPRIRKRWPDSKLKSTWWFSLQAGPSDLPHQRSPDSDWPLQQALCPQLCSCAGCRPRPGLPVNRQIWSSLIVFSFLCFHLKSERNYVVLSWWHHCLGWWTLVWQASTGHSPKGEPLSLLALDSVIIKERKVNGCTGHIETRN